LHLTNLTIKFLRGAIAKNKQSEIFLGIAPNFELLFSIYITSYRWHTAVWIVECNNHRHGRHDVDIEIAGKRTEHEIYIVWLLTPVSFGGCCLRATSTVTLNRKRFRLLSQKTSKSVYFFIFLLL